MRNAFVVVMIAVAALTLSACGEDKVASAINMNTSALVNDTNAVSALVDSQNNLANKIDAYDQHNQEAIADLKEHIDDRFDEIEDRLIETQDVVHDIAHAQETQGNIPVVVVK